MVEVLLSFTTIMLLVNIFILAKRVDEQESRIRFLQYTTARQERMIQVLRHQIKKESEAERRVEILAEMSRRERYDRSRNY